MTKIYQAFKWEHVTIEDNTEKAESGKAKEEPTRAVPISIIIPITRPNPEVTLIKSSSRPPLTDPILKIHLTSASKVVQKDPDEPIRVPYMINGKMHYLTNDEINAILDKEDKIKKAAEEAKMIEDREEEEIRGKHMEFGTLEIKVLGFCLMKLNKLIAEHPDQETAPV
ncbi:hypothetical protein Tco_0664986 [Tanacetum coccineum]